MRRLFFYPTLLIILLILITGCVNPYREFYKPINGLNDAKTHNLYDSSAVGLEIYTTDNFERDIVILMAKSYMPIGQSSFSAGAGLITEANLRSHAKEVGAHAVLINSSYSNTIQGAIPFNVPKTSTTYHSGTATAFGPGGYATAYGTGTSTMHSSQTVMMPYSVARYNVGALYFAKMKHRLGVVVLPLRDEDRLNLQSNSGVRVVVVAEGTPAFFADIFPGDLILEITGEPTYSPQEFSQILNRHEGEEVEIVLYRDGKVIRKSVRLLQI